LSQTIIDCFLKATQKKLELSVKNNLFSKEKVWKIETQTENYLVEKLILATGSNPKFGKCFRILSRSCHPVPSLFTFNIKDSRIKELPGVAAQVTVTTKLINRTFINYTLGMSGPAILKLSAWGVFA
jgi:predicted flavoprotein YhiN